MIVPTATNPVIDANKAPTQQYRGFFNELGKLDILTGSGTPEGNQIAEVGRLYMDTSGTAGSILYIKRDNDIAGDTSKGWILI